MTDTPDCCHATIWHFHNWWYLIEQHACAFGHGWLLVSHHQSQAEAYAVGQRLYPRRHGRLA